MCVHPPSSMSPQNKNSGSGASAKIRIFKWNLMGISDQPGGFFENAALNTTYLPATQKEDLCVGTIYKGLGYP